METKFWEFLNEISFNLNHTTYEINYHIFNELDVESYFFSKNKNKYSVYFLITTEEDEKLSNGHKLSDYTKLES